MRPENIARARQELGQNLAAVRKAMGLSQHELAAQLGYSRSTVANVETGHQDGTRAFWQKCDLVLKTRHTLTAAFDAIEELASAAGREEAARAYRWMAIPPSPTSHGPGLQRLPEGGLSGHNGSFTGPHGLWDPEVLSEEVAMATDESGQFVRRAGRPISTELLEQLTGDAYHWADQFLLQPPYAVFRPIAQMRSFVFDLLDAHPDPAFTRDLYLLAGQFTALLAHACADLGQPGPADAHARTAWLCAERADHSLLKVYIRWIQANIAYWNGDPRRAAALAAAGRQHASTASSRRRLASQEARAYAAMGDATAVERALSEAAVATEPGAERRSDEVGVWFFEPGKASYYAAEAHLALGGREHQRRAVADAERAIELLTVEPTSSSPELIAAARQDLAAAHLALEDLDGVTHALGPVLRLPAEHRTTPITSRMRKLEAALTGDRSLGALHEEIALFLAYPAHSLPTT